MYQALGNTYAVRTQLRAAGGAWDKASQRWLFQAEPKTKIAGIVFAPSPLPTGWWVHTSYRPGIVGKTVERPLALPAQKRTAEGYVTVLAQWDDKEWDEDAERHRPCTASLTRPATEEEVLQILAERQEAEDRKTALLELRSLGREDPDISYPAIDFHDLPGARYEFEPNAVPHGGGWWVFVGETETWIVQNNGNDGDDWSQNNVKTWGAGAVGRRLPATYVPQVRSLLDRIGATAART